MSQSGLDDGALLDIATNFIPDQTTDSVDISAITRLLKIQLEEVEMLHSMYSNPGEFIMFDPSVITDIQEFIEGKSDELPRRVDFTIHLVVDGKKLEMCVNLPSEYPEEEPDIFVRSDSLSRSQQHQLNVDLTKYICSLSEGDISVYPSVAWLQENADPYFITEKIKKKPDAGMKKNNVNIKFSRYWIYSHHIYNKMKRRCIIDSCLEFNLTGFCLPGKPGILCIEGWETDCSDCWQRIRSMNWKKIVCKKIEQERNRNSVPKESFQKFSGFEEINFDRNKTKSRDFHMDMGGFYKYLSDHNSSYMFKEFFGLEGRAGESVG